MTVNLLFDERKCLLKCYWKVENVFEEEILRSSRLDLPIYPSRLLPLGNFKEHGERHKTTNAGENEREINLCCI